MVLILISCCWLPTPRNGKKNGTRYPEGNTLSFTCNERHISYCSTTSGWWKLDRTATTLRKRLVLIWNTTNSWSTVKSTNIINKYKYHLPCKQNLENLYLYLVVVQRMILWHQSFENQLQEIKPRGELSTSSQMSNLNTVLLNTNGEILKQSLLATALRIMARCDTAKKHNGCMKGGSLNFNFHSKNNIISIGLKHAKHLII